MLNNILQWAGTICFVFMYTLMSFYPNLHPFNIVAGVLGSACYLAWTIRVANKPQMIVNALGMTVCLAGLYKAWG